MIIQIKSAKEFKEIIQQDKVLVDFYADWCLPCKMQAPVLEQYDAGTPKATIAKVNVDLLPELAGEYGVYSIPTLILFVKGALAAKNVSFMPLQPLTRFIDSH